MIAAASFLSPGKPGVAVGSNAAISTWPAGSLSIWLSGLVINTDIVSCLFFFAMR